MKRSLRGIALALAMLMMLTTALFACDKVGDETTNSTTEATENKPSGEQSEQTTQKPESDGKVEYTVNVKTIGGLPVTENIFHIYEEDNLISYGKTDENGVGTVTLKPSNNYTIELSDSGLEGYTIEERYSFDGRTANIVLTSAVIPESDLTGVTYKLGDIMRDFTVTTTNGEKFILSEALKTKKGVLINFWFSTCSPCITEFPYMQSAYEKFSDDIEVIALNNYAADNDAAVKNFKESMGLTFPVAKDYSKLGTCFGITGYPTSIFVDRYGTICLIEVGGLTSEKPFVAAFEHFSAENYEQKLFTSINELTPTEKPNVQMPSSEEIGAILNGNGFSATYTPETDSLDAEYSWPFLIGELDDGTKCIYNSNSYKDSSYAILHATVNMKAGDALAIDWYANTELGADILYILVNDKDIYRLSGISENWATCYPYVALEDGEYKVSFIYLKDGDTDTAEDKIYLKNFRIVNKDAVDVATYIPRQAATKPNSNGLGYQQYITPVFNEKDGYYHVGTADGPILLVNLMSATQLNEESLNQLGYDGKLIDNDGDVYEKLVEYCNYSINGTLYGYCPVTEELKGLIVRAADMIGFEPENSNQWLQACSYYDAYGTDKQLEDPVKGIAFFAAFDTILSTETEEKFNTVTYDGRVIMPRGLKYKFVPEKSGVYFIKSQSEEPLDGWVFNANQEIIHESAVVDRPFGEYKLDTVNVSMIVYLEAGETYYIDIAYYDIYAVGTFTFTVNYIGESYKHFHLASPGYFTFNESTTGQINETIAGGINVALGDDGYFHELRDDGTLGSIIYADFSTATAIFSHSILKIIEMGGFNFSLNETDNEVLTKLKELGGDKDACLKYYKDLWGETYDENAELYKLEEVLAGKYHGTYHNGKPGADLTEDISAYIEKMLPKTDAHPELEGCVPVDEALADLLQKLMDKYSFAGVDHSWTKLCYYYKQLGPETTESEDESESESSTDDTEILETETQSETEIDTEIETETQIETETEAETFAESTTDTEIVTESESLTET